MLRSILWDASMTPERALSILEDEGEAASDERDRLYARVLKGYSWYTVLRLIHTARLPEALRDEVLQRLWPASLRSRYSFARSVLLGDEERE